MGGTHDFINLNVSPSKVFICLSQKKPTFSPSYPLKDPFPINHFFNILHMHGKYQFFRYDNCLGQCSISVKGYHGQGNSYERQHLLINGLVYYLPGGTQADMAAEAYIQIHRHQ